MKKTLKFLILGLLCLTFLSEGISQEKEPSPFDFGRMWPFEYAPIDYFEKQYGFEASPEWIEHVRKSALRFSTYCSASFVSQNGLIMTNHHCSRGEVVSLQEENERFDENGFYAETFEDERRAPGLFVDQLHKIVDVTQDVKEALSSANSPEQEVQIRQSKLQELIKEYGKKEGWADLIIQPVTYYNGGKFSLYGYKRYSDIRLVMIPELDLGYYGGDPDNFTYPRYNLDCTFWRAYDDSGNPLNTSQFYFKYNPQGAGEGEAVFVVGNPGSTERYRTVAQLEYDRDFRFPMQLRGMQDRYDQLEAKYQENNNPQILEEMFGISNGLKAIGGIVKGLNDPALFGRKEAMENLLKERSPIEKRELWNKLDKSYKELSNHLLEVQFFAPNPDGPKALIAARVLNEYLDVLKAGEEDTDELSEAAVAAMQEMTSESEQMKMTDLLSSVVDFNFRTDGSSKPYIDAFMVGGSPEETSKAFAHSPLLTKKGLKALKKANLKKIEKMGSKFLMFSNTVPDAFDMAVKKFQGSAPERKSLEVQIANQVFNVWGEDLPPDATFTLRISDGIIQGYDYNGTQAPYKTTYFGMYDRYYSNNGEFPWSLPARWLNPPIELLKAPINTVSTNDIIGGNSGSALINVKGEAVGLIFDGNIESLPGNFIFDEEFNRAVSVHAGGIYAALKYIYRADRLIIELSGM